MFKLSGQHAWLVCMLLGSCALGQVQEKVLHTFTGPDGMYLPGGLIFDSLGNLYGMAEFGGTDGYGTIYELSPVSGGGWNFEILYSFAGNPDGQYPFSSLAIDRNGNLYGTTVVGGAYGAGTVFELSPSSSDQWAETILYSFGSYQGDGESPEGPLTLDSSGNLYGTTGGGGSTNCTNGCGTVFELTSLATGQWTESTLHAFGGGNDGYNSLSSGVTFDGQGNLYGTTATGGGSGCNLAGCGIVFELMPLQGGSWTEK